MHRMDELLRQFFQGRRAKCPDDLALLEHASLSLRVESDPRRQHIGRCPHCQHRLREIQEIQQLTNARLGAPDWLQAGGGELIEPLLHETADAEEADVSFRLAADTAADTLAEVSFCSDDGQTILRCQEGAHRHWEVTLIQLSEPAEDPVLLEVNEHLYQIVFAGKPVELSELRFKRDPIEHLAIISHIFSFSGDVADLPNRIPAPFLLELKTGGVWKLDKNPDLSRNRAFYWLQTPAEIKSGPLPLEARFAGDIRLYLFDLGSRRFDLEKLD